jgi:diguanylate cyclase
VNAPAATGGHGVHILLVDDNPLHLKVQRLLFEQDGYVVTTAGSAEEALREARSRPFGLVVSDVMMPGTDGFQLCRTLRRDPATATVPVLLVSGVYGENLDLRHAANCGANMFVARSTDPSALRDAVARVLRHPTARIDPGNDAQLDAEHSRRVLRQLELLSTLDALTGLFNRAEFQKRVDRAVADALAGGHAAAVLLVALDGFREINNTLGPEGGDTVLRQCAARLRESLAGTDLVAARFGAAQFALLLSRLEGPQAPRRAARAAQTLLAESVTVDGIPVAVTPRVGYALCPADALLGSELLRRAGIAVRHARERRLAQVAYAPEQDPFSLDQLLLVSELRSALAHNELELWYQPKLNLGAGRVESVEALVRWRHPERGLIPPDRFIPAAEHTGLIQVLTRWVLDTAVAQAVRWRARGWALNVGVNVTQNDLQDRSFPGEVSAILRSHALPPGRLTVEITESAAMHDPDRAVEVLSALRAEGVRIALDDFGVGHASLAHLYRLPLDEIKLDKSFVLALPDAPSRAIAAAAAVLARAFSLRSVAEGVETAAGQALLQSLGFDGVQGFGLSRPLPVAELEAWLEQRPEFAPAAPGRNGPASG